jgi:organic radical activating enzyme
MIRLANLNRGPEIFYSIQGEGKNLGNPSVFIRLSLCNLYCYWCDTDYTWNWKGTAFKHVRDSEPGYQKYNKEDFILQYTNEELIKIIISYNCPNLVFTGGEPIAQQKDLVSLLADLKTINPAFRIEFETNGTIRPSPETDSFADQYNVSLKLSNSRIPEQERIKPDTVKFFAETPKANFKFVIDNESDLEEVLDHVNKFRIPSNKVYLMPQGTTVASLQSKQQWLIELCKKYQFNYTDRLHIHIWGDKRGV